MVHYGYQRTLCFLTQFGRILPLRAIILVYIPCDLILHHSIIPSDDDDDDEAGHLEDDDDGHNTS